MKNLPLSHDLPNVELEQNYIYLAAVDFVEDLRAELNSSILWAENDLFLSSMPPQRVAFAQDAWYQPKLLTIDSIGDAVKKLKALHRFWYPHISTCARRTILIAEQLSRTKKVKSLIFPVTSSGSSTAVFTLLDQHTVLYSLQREKKALDGIFEFAEDKVNPPNRAYLKLWEALTILNRLPKPGDVAVDFGASPGGWTYVLQGLGASVIAIDKAPLAEHIARLPRVETRLVSAFSMKPEDFNEIDWFVCDVACYPEKLYQWLMPWLESGRVKQFIVTIKLQGETDFAALELFKNIPNGRVMHLYQNKHEVTFFWPYNVCENT